MPAATDLEELRRLVRQARMLVAAEREGGVVELPGTAAPPSDTPVGGPVARTVAATIARGAAPPPVVQHPSAVAHPPEPDSRIAARADATLRPSPATTSRPFVPLVRALELPPDALAPFGALVDEVAGCRRCALCEGRTRTVFGEGSATARLVFCGEAPGFDEDRSGRPFVGRAGELLTAMIEKGLKMRREDVFILNAIKCRPPDNRTPLPAEIAACRPFLERQLARIRPSVIVALGNPASRALLGDVPGISAIRGKVFEAFRAKVVPTFHPAYLLRTPDAKRDAWNDLKTVRGLLGEPAG